MRVEVTEKATVRTGNYGKIIEQKAYAQFDGEKYPRPININPPDDLGEAGYAPGNYDVDFGKSMSVGKYDKLEMGRKLHLVKVK